MDLAFSSWILLAIANASLLFLLIEILKKDRGQICIHLPVFFTCKCL